MRILHCADYYLPRVGGIETMVSNLGREQRARGCAVAVATGGLPGYAAEEVIDGIPVFRRRASDMDLIGDPRLLLRFVEDLVAAKRRWQPDVVHVHGAATSAWINLLAGKSPPTVLTLHSWPPHLPQGVQRRVIAEARCLTAVSASTREAYAALAAGRDEPIQVIHNGIAPPALAPRPLGFEPAVALCYGRLVDDKGFDVALRAFARIPRLQVVIAGDGAARPGLEQLAGELGLAERIVFRGWIDPGEVSSLINDASVVVVPTRLSEAFGLVALEAALMGRPVVASRLGGLAEVVDDGETGLLVAAEDPPALAEAIRTLVDDSARATAMGALARDRALQRFSIARCASEYDAVYDRAIRGRQ